MADPSTDAIQNRWIWTGVLAAFSGVGIIFSGLVGMLGWMSSAKVKSLDKANENIFERIGDLETDMASVRATQVSDQAHIRDSLRRVENGMTAMTERFNALTQALCVGPKREGQ